MNSELVTTPWPCLSLQLQTTLEDRIKKERHEWEEKYHRSVGQLEQRNAEIDAINKVR